MTISSDLKSPYFYEKRNILDTGEMTHEKRYSWIMDDKVHGVLQD